MGKPKVEYVDTTQKQELDPIAQGYFWSGQLPEDKLASLRRINEQVYGVAPNSISPPINSFPASNLGTFAENPTQMEYYSPEARRQRAIDDVLYGHEGGMAGTSVPTRSLGDTRPVARGESQDVGMGIGDYFSGVRDAAVNLGRSVAGMDPRDENKKANGGIVALANGGMVPPMMGGRMPNLSNQDIAYQMAMRAMRPKPYATGGYIEGPGTGTSDSIPATIYQDGQPVEDVALSDGEFVMTERAVRDAGNGDPRAGAARMYEMMRKFERGGRVG